MAGENSYFASGGPDPHRVLSGPEFSPTKFSDRSLNGWDFEIDQTRLNPSHLLSDAAGINPYGFTLPPDSVSIDLGSTSWIGSGLDRLDVVNDQNSFSSLLINTDLGSTSWTRSGLDRLDVQNDQNSLSSLLVNTNDVAEGLEHSPKISSPELSMWLNELESEKEVGNDLLMEAIGVQRDIIPQNEQSMDARKGKKKNTGGRPMIPISYEKLLQCKGRKLEAAANEVLDVSVSTLKHCLQPLTGYKTWSEF